MVCVNFCGLRQLRKGRGAKNRVLHHRLNMDQQKYIYSRLSFLKKQIVHACILIENCEPSKKSSCQWFSHLTHQDRTLCCVFLKSLSEPKRVRSKSSLRISVNYYIFMEQLSLNAIILNHPVIKVGNNQYFKFDQ